MLEKYCKLAGIDYKEASLFKRRHPELTDEDIVIHFNPYCYYNITGDLIIVRK